MHDFCRVQLELATRKFREILAFFGGMFGWDNLKADVGGHVDGGRVRIRLSVREGCAYTVHP